MDLSIIVPCHNEEKNIELLMNECEKTFANSNIKIEYIFVNDGSKDNTFEEIKKLLVRKDRVIGIDFSRNFGKESAIYAGLEKSSGKYVALIDADLQQHPKYVLSMYNFIVKNSNYDCVCCYQEKRKENTVISFLKKLFYKVINKTSDIEFYDNASDFRLFSRKMTDSLLQLKEYYRFSKGFFSWCGFETYYIPYEVEERKYGKSSWSFFSLIKYAIDGIIGFSVSPLKIATYTGMISFMLSIIYLIIILIQKITIGIEISGYATIVCLILLFGGIQMIFIGIIGEYLGRVYIETKRRPIYLVKEVKTNAK